MSHTSKVKLPTPVPINLKEHKPTSVPIKVTRAPVNLQPTKHLKKESYYQGDYDTSKYATLGPSYSTTIETYNLGEYEYLNAELENKSRKSNFYDKDQTYVGVL